LLVAGAEVLVWLTRVQVEPTVQVDLAAVVQQVMLVMQILVAGVEQMLPVVAELFT
jgi:hypothetical protein